jgi:hypothetical protein
MPLRHKHLIVNEDYELIRPFTGPEKESECKIA